MLKDRILATLRFFDLQDLPLTLVELHYFLIADLNQIRPGLNSQYEFSDAKEFIKAPATDISEVLLCLDTECANEAGSYKGFYFLTGRQDLVNLRLANYLYGIKREKLIRRYTKILRHLPFLRAVAIAGSQALGQQKSNSDIDLFIIIEPKFLWLARTLITAYFQVIGLRRHGKYIANRFCLNHYLAGAKEIDQYRNLYTAMEYAKLRPVVYAQGVQEFQRRNLFWINFFFPNAYAADLPKQQPALLQQWLEKLFGNFFGLWLDTVLKSWQLPKIHQEKYIVVAEDELSFHPDSKQKQLLERFFS